MAKRYQVHAQNEDGTEGESPKFTATSPEDAANQYKRVTGALPVITSVEELKD